MPSPYSACRAAFLGLCFALGLALPAAAQEPALHASPEALASQFVGPWQGTWVGPDGHAWSGDWRGDLLTPDGRAVGPEEFAHFAGTAFLVIHPPAPRDGVDWSGEWLENCHNRMRYNGLDESAAPADSCANWLRFYRKSGLLNPAYAYAVPVSLLLSPRRGCDCHTVTTQTVTEYVTTRRWHHARHRAGLHSKELRLRVSK